MPATIANTFKLPNTSQALFTSLRHVIDFISGNLPRYADAASINFKVKVIIAELLNNALKHTADTDTLLNVVIGEKNICIEKMDYGNRFNPNNLIVFPVKKEYKVQLSSDALNSMYAFVEPEAFIRFYCEEKENESQAEVNDINEHFGLLIITKSADDFTYNYDQTSGLNKFSISLKLN